MKNNRMNTNNGYKCEIVADSLNTFGNRITTFKVTYPRIVHAEMCRHRVLSRNTASSRAIPFAKMVKDVQENPFIPIAWQRDHKGMQGTEYITNKIAINNLNSQWLKARDEAIKNAKSLNNGAYTLEVAKDEDGNKMRGFNRVDIPDTFVTKQLCNRLLEPFVWTTELITGTEWENFFKLRCPQYAPNENADEVYRSKKEYEIIHGKISNYTDLDWLKINTSQADVHIQAIAELMWNEMNESTPKQLQAGEWHIPFGDNINLFETQKWLGEESYKVKIATARCARISYETLGDNPKIDYEADIKLHDRLLAEGHMSPMEHCARVMSEEEYWHYFIADPEKTGQYGWCGNFKGFIQYRHLIENNS